ncbi:Hypothetical predicted protein [Pelobates cultripes]|uniref:Uncharacterized protein n=1 Tax=Pelobates cultripes TaxID=61616 RepID=A0AAD1R652_PELCU|nr:Hypothetical predicted protein [Pelobates cultripes]
MYMVDITLVLVEPEPGEEELSWMEVDEGGGPREPDQGPDHLWGFIRKQKGFMSQESEKMCTAIRRSSWLVTMLCGRNCVSGSRSRSATRKYLGAYCLQTF